jgi:predicted nucleic acid-binding protein
MNAVLVDTNLLVYAHDRGEPEKQAQAIQVLDDLERESRGVLSVQCLAEFFNIATRGKTPKLTLSQASDQVTNLIASWMVLDLTSQIVQEATRGVRDHQLGYWDAQLWATAKLNQIPIILSEDFNIGQSLEGVRFVNPFAPDFSIERWVSF